MLLALLAVFLGGVYVWVERAGREPGRIARAQQSPTTSTRAENSSSPLAAPEDRTAGVRESASSIGRVTLDPTSGESCAVRGQVVDEDGASVANVTLLAMPVSEGPTPEASPRTADEAVEDSRVLHSAVALGVDACGEFVQRGLPSGRWELLAGAPGYDPRRLELGELAAGTRLDDVVVRLERSPRMRVIVSWPDGTPVESAEIGTSMSPDSRRLRRSANAPSRDDRAVVRGADGHRAWTDARGICDLPIQQQGAWVVSATAERAVAVECGIALPAEVLELLAGRRIEWSAGAHGAWPAPTELRLVLAPRPCVVGRVVDAHGDPVADARVEAWISLGESLISAGGSTPVDRDGAYVLSGLRIGQLSLAVTAGPRVAAGQAELETTVPFQRRDFTLLRAPTLAGIVRDSRGRPRADIDVALHWIEAASPDAKSSTSKTSESAARLLRRQSMAHVPRKQRVVSDEMGRFRFENAPAGRVRLTTSVSDGLPSAPLELTVAGGEDQLNLELRLRVGATIEGRAYGRDGVRLSGRILHFFPEGDEEHVQSGLIDDAGTFRLNRIEPGRWVLRMPLDEEPQTTDETAHIEPVLLTQTIEVADGARVSVVLAPR